MLKKIWEHLIQTDQPEALREIRDNESVNGVLYSPQTPVVLTAYLQNLTPGDLVLAEPLETANTYDFIGPDITFEAGKTTVADVKAILLRGFPDRSGIDAFARDVTDTLSAFSKATGYKNVEGGLMLSLPGDTGCWHHDNDTDVRGFKAYRSDGPLLRANSTIEEWKPEIDFYGTPKELRLPAGATTQMKAGDFGIWKGDCHDFPLIHVKPEVRDNEMRISMIVNPPAEDYDAMRQTLGLKRFYKEPSGL